MKRIILFFCVLVFSIFSNTNNLLAKEIENNIKDNISNEIEEIKPDNEKISLCKVRIGGFESRTKCLEDIPADIEINTDESSLRSINIYPYSPIP